MQAVILAGGFGKRLKPLTDSRPKPMIVVGGVPILERQIRWLTNFGVKEIILCVGYKKEVILNYVSDGHSLGAHVSYSVETEPLGTGGALKRAEELIDGESFVLMYGDIVTDINLQGLVDAMDHSHEAVMAAIPTRSPFGVLDVKGDTIIGFVEKPILKDIWMNAGVYCLYSSILSRVPKKGSFESITLARLAIEGKLKMLRCGDSVWRSIDTHKDIEEADKEFEHLIPIPEPIDMVSIKQ